MSTTVLSGATRRNFFGWVRYPVFLALMVAILALDSQALYQIFPYGQWLASLATFIYFFYIYRLCSPRLKRLMLIGLFISLLGEVSFSLVIHMYEYRLKNIPFYVPPGHTILYAQVFMFVREPWVLRHAARLKWGMFGTAALFSLSWLVFRHDLYGFICFGVFCFFIMLVRRESQLFFLTMYLLVAYLELWGTSLGCWYWHPFLLNRWPAISSANPPSSISVFYMAFDLTCLGVYLLFNLKSRQRYVALKAYRRALRTSVRSHSQSG
jgi:hypothetical protein